MVTEYRILIDFADHNVHVVDPVRGDKPFFTRSFNDQPLHHALAQAALRFMYSCGGLSMRRKRDLAEYFLSKN